MLEQQSLQSWHPSGIHGDTRPHKERERHIPGPRDPKSMKVAAGAVSFANMPKAVNSHLFKKRKGTVSFVIYVLFHKKERRSGHGEGGDGGQH